MLIKRRSLKKKRWRERDRKWDCKNRTSLIICNGSDGNSVANGSQRKREVWRGDKSRATCTASTTFARLCFVALFFFDRVTPLRGLTASRRYHSMQKAEDAIENCSHIPFNTRSSGQNFTAVSLQCTDCTSFHVCSQWIMDVHFCYSEYSYFLLS